jgi:hypothetical protein
MMKLQPWTARHDAGDLVAARRLFEDQTVSDA